MTLLTHKRSHRCRDDSRSETPPRAGDRLRRQRAAVPQHSALPSMAHGAHAVIYRPTRGVMQSGLARTLNWVLEFEPRAPQRLDHLMGWCGSTDALTHVQLRFPTAEQAIVFAERNGLRFAVRRPAIAHRQPRSYADNFKR